MILVDPDQLELSEAWQDGDETARWRSGSGHSPRDGASSSGSSILEVESGHKLPRHTDSAEEMIVVLDGTAAVIVGEDRATLPRGAIAVVPKLLPHEVRNGGETTLRFAAIYAEPDVITRYDREVQPDGSAERHTVSSS